MRSGSIERVWYGEDRLAAAARLALLPAELVFRAVTRLRERLYDGGMLHSIEPALPTISIGNLTVGGTGKTPVAAWIAGQLLERGARPAVVLRGYGDDEPRVHEILNPLAIVIANPDRVAGVAAARASGAAIAVLDDGFQHRRVRREVDLVLVSADRWRGDAHLLPAGPFRERLGALTRATLIIVTRKAATDAEVNAVNAALADRAPRVPRITVGLALDELVGVGTGERLPLERVRGRTVHLLAAVGDPRALIRQLELAGARVEPSIFGDHHAFTAMDVERFRATLGDDAFAVCTLKDAVKLERLWPRAAGSLWYVSQRVTVERGVGGIERLLDDLIRAANLPHL